MDKSTFFSKSFPSTKHVKPCNLEKDEDAVKALVNESSTQSRALLPFSEAERLCVLPLGFAEKYGNTVLRLAAIKGREESARMAVRFHTGMDVVVTSRSKEIIQEALFRSYKGESKVLDFVGALTKRVPENDGQTDSVYSYNSGKGVAAKSLESLVDYAICNQLSDIHITPLRSGVKIRVRKDGNLLEREDLVGDKKFHQEVVNRLKVLVKAPAGPLSEPIDGSFLAGMESLPVQVRVSLMPSVHGENIVLRVLENSRTIPLDELGYNPLILERLEESSKKSNGLIIIAGSTGSGKTTTLYALANLISGSNRLVHTLEEPVEKICDGLVQTELQSRDKKNTEKHLAAILRQDPDCIFLGELRESKGAKTMLQAALSGHLTITTLHARSVLDAVLRFKHFGIEQHEVLQSLQALVCQKLVSLLCADCKVLDASSSKLFGFSVYQAVGCNDCSYSGYAGRKPVVEALFARAGIISGMSYKDINLEQLSKNGVYFNHLEPLRGLLLEGLIDAETFDRHRL